MEINRHGVRMYAKLDLKNALKEKRAAVAFKKKAEDGHAKKLADLERKRRKILRKAGKLYKK